MKRQNIKQFDDKEVEITDILVSLGLGRAVARTLAFLNDGEEATSVALEQGSDVQLSLLLLWQPASKIC